jgi:hypothetical protein
LSTSAAYRGDAAASELVSVAVGAPNSAAKPPPAATTAASAAGSVTRDTARRSASAVPLDAPVASAAFEASFAAAPLDASEIDARACATGTAAGDCPVLVASRSVPPLHATATLISVAMTSLRTRRS